MENGETNMNTLERIESLQEAHKQLDRECTDLEKQLAGGINSENHDRLVELKKRKLFVKDQIESLRKELDFQA
jgi:hypothetical protein